jgi:hypothetical protein
MPASSVGGITPDRHDGEELIVPRYAEVAGVLKTRMERLLGASHLVAR